MNKIFCGDNKNNPLNDANINNPLNDEEYDYDDDIINSQYYS